MSHYPITESEVGADTPVRPLVFTHIADSTKGLTSKIADRSAKVAAGAEATVVGMAYFGVEALRDMPLQLKKKGRAQVH